MKTRGFLLASLLVVAVMAGFAWYTAGLLPEGTQLPTHFDGAGLPDRYSDALTALLLPPGILLALSLVFAALPLLEPLQEKLEGSAHLLRVAWIGLIALLVAIELTVAAPAYEWPLSATLILSAAGVMLVAIGNALPKSRPGFFVGIRTPWTITNTDNWIATHRLGGKLLMLAGLVWIAVPFLPISGDVRRALTIGSVVVGALIPVVYSWWLWRRNKRTTAETAGQAS
jgi:uncharacterized membrane protein